jgi:GrpB-like predicted nucleotidyltransferase (UPF0157 family)
VISPPNTKVSPGTMVSTKYSSTWPSSRPPRGITVRGARAHEADFEHVGSTMVPTLSR